MDIWEVIILSIIQGLTEFLPISSSAHLILVSELIRGKEEIIFDVAVHLGSLLAAIVYFRKDLLSMILNLSLHYLQSNESNFQPDDRQQEVLDKANDLKWYQVELLKESYDNSNR